MELVIRAFVEVGTQAQAEVIASELARILGGLAELQSSKVEQYWKIPEYFEILLAFEVSTQEDDPVAAASTLLGSGWHMLRKTEAIWNPGPAKSFRANSVKWAQIELLE